MTDDRAPTKAEIEGSANYLISHANWLTIVAKDDAACGLRSCAALKKVRAEDGTWMLGWGGP